MKALSLQQPFAHLTIFHGKDVENRDWPTSYRGPILIHAGKRPDPRVFVETQVGGRYLLESRLPCGLWEEGMPRTRTDCQYGGIIGCASLVDCVQESASPWFRGIYGFVLRDIRPLPFIPLRGQLGLFDVDEKLLAPYLGKTSQQITLQVGQDSTSLRTLLTQKAALARPVIVCLCGSTRFTQAFREAKLRETLAGRIVLSIGCDTKSDHDLALGPIDKTALDLLHLFKIDLADEILVLNVGGYIGESTRWEIEYARMVGKRVRWLEPLGKEGHV